MPFDVDSLLLLKKLNREFYLCPVVDVARNLLGKIFVKVERGKILAGLITEVEAYNGINDEASHSFKGKTYRNRHMFYPGGFTYVYFTYGVHHCLNVVAGDENFGAAVLIRAMEPLVGIEIFALRRFRKKNISEKEYINLLNGPGKICQAFNLSVKNSGIDLLGDKMFILDYKKIKKNQIGQSSRIGISKSVDFPWRFFIKNSEFLSR
jgi:DNA-3-methyladenine glycosylase